LGEMIVAGGPPNGEANESRKCALYSNCLTYTYSDYPFINHHWGSEVIFYLIHKVGGFSTLIIFKAIVLGLAFSVTLFHSLGLNKGPAFLKRPGLLRLTTAVTLVFFSIQMMADRLTTRPEIFGYLFFSLVFLILSRSYIKCYITFYMLPVIMLLWVNLHISFIFGIILIWIWTAIKMFSYRSSVISYRLQVNQLSVNQLKTESPKTGKPDTENRKLKTDNWAILAIPTISTLVTIFNPSGLRGALMPLSILKDYGYTIVENMNPFFLSAFKPQPEYWIYSLFLITTIVLFLFSTAQKNPFYLLTFLVFGLFPLIAVRHLPFFALAILPILTTLIPNNGKFAKLPIIASFCLLIAALTNPIPLAYTKLPPVNLSADSRHDPAIEFVKQNNLKGAMWNNYDIGSFLEWTLPEQPTFVDGRPEAFPAGFFQEIYIPMQESQQKWDEVTATNDIQWTFVALTDATPWFTKWRQMTQVHQGWRIVYFDNFSAVLVKTGGINDSIQPQGKARLTIY